MLLKINRPEAASYKLSKTIQLRAFNVYYEHFIIELTIKIEVICCFAVYFVILNNLLINCSRYSYMNYSYDSIIKFARNSRYNDFSCFFLTWCYFEKHILRDKNINSLSKEP